MSTVIVLWNSDYYPSLEVAQANGAVTEHTIPEDRMHDKDNYVGAFTWGMMRAMQRIYGVNSNVLQYELVEEHEYHVECQVLEWNTYRVCVTASSSEEAIAKVKEEHILSMQGMSIASWGDEVSDLAEPRDYKVSNVTDD